MIEKFLFIGLIFVGSALHELPIRTFTGELDFVVKMLGMTMALLGAAMYARYA